MSCSHLRSNNNRLVFSSYLIPGSFSIHLPITMGYDRFPELLINEKKTLLSSLAKENAWLFYTHDPDFAVSKVQFNDKEKAFIDIDNHKDLKKIPF